MKVLIVDDEPLARLELHRLLAAFPGIVIAGEARNSDEAETAIRALAPDLVFLDIQMPGGTGFDLLARLNNPPRVIFTTAYDQHAVRAFEVNALDYLLKPVEPERLAAAMTKARALPAPSAQAPLAQIFVRDGPKCWFVPLTEVALLAAEGNYVRLFWGSERPLLSRSLVALEARLDPERFFRANRQQIVNLGFVEKVEPDSGGRLLARMRSGEMVEISRRQARLFRSRMSL